MNRVRDAATLLRQRVDAREVAGFTRDVALMRKALELLEAHLEQVKHEEAVAAAEDESLRARFPDPCGHNDDGNDYG